MACELDGQDDDEGDEDMEEEEDDEAGRNLKRGRSQFAVDMCYVADI